MKTRNSTINVQTDKFSSLPDELVIKIAALEQNQKAKSIFSLTCHRFHRVSQAERLADRLLLAAIRREQIILSAILQKYPYLIFKKGTAKNDAGQLFNCTSTEYAIYVKDWYVVDDLLKHMITLELSSEQKRHVENLNKSLSQKSDNSQKVTYQDAYFEYIAHSVAKNDKQAWTVKERREAIERINKLDPNKHAVALRIAHLEYIDNFAWWNDWTCEIARQKIISLESARITDSFHYDLIPVIEAYYQYIHSQKYINNSYLWSSEQSRDFCCQVIGFFQERMPRFYIAQLCHPSRPFNPIPEFNEVISPPPAKLSHGRLLYSLSDYFLNLKLGVDFALCRGDSQAVEMKTLNSWGGGALGGMSAKEAAIDLRAFVALFEVGTRKLVELEQKLLSNPSPTMVPGLT